MEQIKEILKEFIEWSDYCGEDAWYIFDHTDEAIDRFLKERENS